MMIVILLLHDLCALFLIGALTHQTAAAWRSTPLTRRPTSIAASFSAVRASVYARSIAISYVITMVLGDVLYGPYRVDVKTAIFDLELWSWNGIFEIKEHLVALGFFLLVPYVILWHTPQDAALARSRRLLTTLLTIIVWYALVAGHLLNNLKGVGL